MTPHDINAALRNKGYNQTQVASSLMIEDRSVVSHVIYGRGRSQRVEKRISKLIKKPLHEIFPEWYQKTHSEAA